MTEPEQIVLEAKGEPLALTFGPAEGMHVVAKVGPEGEIVFRPSPAPDRTPGVQAGHGEDVLLRVSEDWKAGPDEASAVFELRNGKELLRTLSFPARSEDIDPAKEIQINSDWHEVLKFMGAHGIAFAGLHEPYCQAAIEAHIERLVAPIQERPALPEPGRMAEVGHAR